MIGQKWLGRAKMAQNWPRLARSKAPYSKDKSQSHRHTVARVPVHGEYFESFWVGGWLGGVETLAYPSITNPARTQACKAPSYDVVNIMV